MSTRPDVALANAIDSLLRTNIDRMRRILTRSIFQIEFSGRGRYFKIETTEAMPRPQSRPSRNIKIRLHDFPPQLSLE